jgi:hypothetical protein
MKLTHQLLQYSEHERLALISCIASIATLDKVANEEEIDFILALVEAANLDAVKTKSVVEAARDPQNSALNNTIDIIANNDSRYFFANEILPFIKFNKDLSNQKKVQHIIDQLDATNPYSGDPNAHGEQELEPEGSFLEKIVISLYLK